MNKSSTSWVNSYFKNLGTDGLDQINPTTGADLGCATGKTHETDTVCYPEACPSGTCGPAPPPPNRLCPPDESWIWDDTTCSWSCDYPTSPVLVDVSGSGFQLTSAAGGVSYDIRGNGIPIQIAWTAPGAQNAFLCLPDSNGACDDGKDLFGNFTPQPASSTPNGFAALAVYDANHDGVIDARDAIFSSLRLWIDANHDGISQPNEIFTLPQLGITSISLNYKLDKRTDQYGNVFRYRAQVGSTDGAGRWAYDVLLSRQSGGNGIAQSCPAAHPQRLLPEGKDGRLR